MLGTKHPHACQQSVPPKTGRYMFVLIYFLIAPEATMPAQLKHLFVQLCIYALNNILCPHIYKLVMSCYCWYTVYRALMKL